MRVYLKRYPSMEGPPTPPDYKDIENSSFWFKVKIVLVAGVGFFTDAYDLFTMFSIFFLKTFLNKMIIPEITLSQCWVMFITITSPSTHCPVFLTVSSRLLRPGVISSASSFLVTWLIDWVARRCMVSRYHFLFYSIIIL